MFIITNGEVKGGRDTFRKKYFRNKFIVRIELKSGKMASSSSFQFVIAFPLTNLLFYQSNVVGWFFDLSISLRNKQSERRALSYSAPISLVQSRVCVYACLRRIYIIIIIIANCVG